MDYEGENSLEDYCADVLSNVPDDYDLEDTSGSDAAFRGTPGPTVFPTNTSMVDEFVDMFIGNDLFEFIATETNRYHAQNCGKYKEQKKCQMVRCNGGRAEKVVCTNNYNGTRKKTKNGGLLVHKSTDRDSNIFQNNEPQ